MIEVALRENLITASYLALSATGSLVIPDMPDVIAKLDKEIRSRYPNQNHIIEIIESNTVIAGEILATVKSAIFMRHVKRDIEVKTISHVVSLIGVKHVYRLAVAAAIKNIPQKNTLFRSIIDHSSDVAIACAEISGYVHGITIDDAYLFGLFRNCGAICMAVSLGNAYESHWERIKSFPVKGVLKELETFGTRHDYLGVTVARKWGFGRGQSDEAFLIAIQEHHNAVELEHIANEYVRLIVAIGLLAEILVNEINGDTYMAAETTTVKKAAINTLYLADDTIASIRANILSALVAKS